MLQVALEMFTGIQPKQNEKLQEENYVPVQCCAVGVVSYGEPLAVWTSLSAAQVMMEVELSVQTMTGRQFRTQAISDESLCRFQSEEHISYVRLLLTEYLLDINCLCRQLNRYMDARKEIYFWQNAMLDFHWDLRTDLC